jgi:hypothetical protein
VKKASETRGKGNKKFKKEKAMKNQGKERKDGEKKGWLS